MGGIRGWSYARRRRCPLYALGKDGMCTLLPTLDPSQLSPPKQFFLDCGRGKGGPFLGAFGIFSVPSVAVPLYCRFHPLPRLETLETFHAAACAAGWGSPRHEKIVECYASCSSVSSV